MLNSKYVQIRRLFFIIMFFVVVPVIAISAFYITTHLNNRGATFDSNEVITSFTKFEKGIDNDEYEVLVAKTEQLTLYLRVYEITLVGDNEEDQDLRYRIQMRYEVTGTDTVRTPVTAKLILKAPWSNRQTNVDSSSVTIGYSNRYITFSDISFPFSPVFLVNVDAPVLYLQLVYNYNANAGLNDITKTVYFSYNMAKINTVVDQIAQRDE